MEENTFMRADDVAKAMDVSKSFAYKIIKQFNEELKAKGFFTISGRISKQYFLERTCYKDERK